MSGWDNYTALTRKFKCVQCGKTVETGVPCNKWGYTVNDWKKEPVCSYKCMRAWEKENVFNIEKQLILETIHGNKRKIYERLRRFIFLRAKGMKIREAAVKCGFPSYSAYSQARAKHFNTEEFAL